MPAEKLSISLDEELATAIRSAAASDGVSVSSWIASAAEQRATREHLRAALEAFDQAFEPLQPGEAQRLIAAARSSSTVTRPNISDTSGRPAKRKASPAA
jgi:hypothetical protein